jgi:hypothetical protein
MAMVQISDETVSDIKDSLQALKTEKTNLRIYGSIG